MFPNYILFTSGIMVCMCESYGIGGWCSVCVCVCVCVWMNGDATWFVGGVIWCIWVVCSVVWYGVFVWDMPFDMWLVWCDICGCMDEVYVGSFVCGWFGVVYVVGGDVVYVVGLMWCGVVGAMWCGVVYGWCDSYGLRIVIKCGLWSKYKLAGWYIH